MEFYLMNKLFDSSEESFENEKKMERSLSDMDLKSNIYNHPPRNSLVISMSYDESYPIYENKNKSQENPLGNNKNNDFEKNENKQNHNFNIEENNQGEDSNSSSNNNSPITPTNTLNTTPNTTPEVKKTMTFTNPFSKITNLFKGTNENEIEKNNNNQLAMSTNNVENNINQEKNNKNNNQLAMTNNNVNSPNTNIWKRAASELFNKVRSKVSADKQRYKEGQFDLDLTYITERIIAMSYPAAGMESTYRNNLDDVAQMLNEKHPSSYLVFNLSQRAYDYSKLNELVADWCGFPDHAPPPLSLLFEICHFMLDWFLKKDENVCVVHCLAGKVQKNLFFFFFNNPSFFFF